MGSNSAGLTTALSTLVNALQTNQSSLSYVSDNIANVSTTGYTKRIIAQETKVSAGTGVGVGIAEIRRSIDEFLLKSVRAQLSRTGESSTLNAYYDRLQQFSFGNPNSSFTVNNSLNQFYSRLDGLAGEASSAVKRNLVVNSAKDFTNTVSELATNIQTERFNADTEISSTIDTVNAIVENLFDINNAIRQSTAVGGDLNSLYDARDFQINKLKEILDVDLTFDDFGQVSASLSSTELLGFSGRSILSYERAASVDTFISGGALGAITATTLNDDGTESSNTTTLLSASAASTSVDNIPGGKLRALIDLRDTKLPAALAQLDRFAYTFANEFNEIHNSGTGFPPPRTLTGTTSTTLSESRNFTGQTRITLVDDNGNPVPGRFGEDLTPLNIDFSRLNGGDGFGTATTQSIINEINSRYGTQPANIANIGPAQDIRLAAVSDSVTSVSASGSISFAANPADGTTIVINGVTFTFEDTPALATDIQRGVSLTETMANIAETLNASSNTSVNIATYSVVTSTLNVDFDLAGTSGNSFLLGAGTSGATPSGANLTGGANASGNFTFDLDFSNLAADGEDITFDVTQISINGGLASAVTFNPYTQNAGDRFRTNQEGTSNDSITTSLTGLGLEEGDTFTVTTTIVVVDGEGVSRTEDVTFTVTIPDPDENIINKRYAATAIGSNDGELVAGSSTAAFATASLVDANGNTITDDTTPGYLKISTSSSSYRVSIDQLDSNEEGLVGTDSADSATGRGFSHFFGLNNFFTFGDELSNSAINIAVRSDIATNPSLLATGKVKQSLSTGTDSIYTYELGSGSNETALDLLRLQNTNISFAAAGGLPELSTTLNFYASEIYSFAASQANTAASAAEKDTLLASALGSKVDDISGVNLDEELALTIQIQNAYSAAAKVLGIVRELFTKIESVLG